MEKAGTGIYIEPPFYCEQGANTYIGDNVWIGALAIVNPGVTIGCNTIIGYGSVVTRDIPEGVIAAGNPCKVIRAITDEDKEHWQRLHKQYLDETVQQSVRSSHLVQDS